MIFILALASIIGTTDHEQRLAYGIDSTVPLSGC